MKKIDLNLPFFSCIQKSTTDAFKVGDEVDISRVGISPDAETVRYEHKDPAGGSSKTLEPVEEIQLEALVVDSEAAKRLTISFRNPADAKQMITVVVKKESSKPGGVDEIDGVWVAQDGGTDQPPSA